MQINCKGELQIRYYVIHTSDSYIYLSVVSSVLTSEHVLRHIFLTSFLIFTQLGHGLSDTFLLVERNDSA